MKKSFSYLVLLVFASIVVLNFYLSLVAEGDQTHNPLYLFLQILTLASIGIILFYQKKGIKL